MHARWGRWRMVEQIESWACVFGREMEKAVVRCLLNPFRSISSSPLAKLLPFALLSCFDFIEIQIAASHHVYLGMCLHLHGRPTFQPRHSRIRYTHQSTTEKKTEGLREREHGWEMVLLLVAHHQGAKSMQNL